jgi:hypothetical protein
LRPTIDRTSRSLTRLSCYRPRKRVGRSKSGDEVGEWSEANGR